MRYAAGKCPKIARQTLQTSRHLGYQLYGLMPVYENGNCSVLTSASPRMVSLKSLLQSLLDRKHLHSLEAFVPKSSSGIDRIRLFFGISLKKEPYHQSIISTDHDA